MWISDFYFQVKQIYTLVKCLIGELDARIERAMLFDYYFPVFASKIVKMTFWGAADDEHFVKEIVKMTIWLQRTLCHKV